jgi:hypothetical protein
MTTRFVAMSALAVVGVGLLAGCPDDDKNPAVLWLAPNVTEAMVHLVDGNPGGY